MMEAEKAYSYSPEIQSVGTGEEKSPRMHHKFLIFASSKLTTSSFITKLLSSTKLTTNDDDG